MRKNIWKLAILSAAVLLAATLVPFSVSAEEAATPETQTALEQPLAATTEAQSMVGKTDELILPGSCLSSTPLSCANMPGTPSSTCSCTSQLQPVRCKSCEGGKGQVLKTTCTVQFTCSSPPCDIQQNITRTGYSCAS